MRDDDIHSHENERRSEKNNASKKSQKLGPRPYVELLQRNENGTLSVPVQSAKSKTTKNGDGVLLIELGGRDSTSSDVSNFLYTMEISNGQSSEVFEVKATMSWSRKDLSLSEATEKVCI